MSYVKGWQNRLENYADFYVVTGGSITTAVHGESQTTPVILYGMSFFHTGTSAMRVQLVNASTTADAVTATANLALELIVTGAGSAFNQTFNHGLYLPKGLVVNMTATAGQVNLTLHQMHVAS